jgi:hypothetical protein
LAKVIPFLGIALLVLMSSVAQAQNTKGDKPQGAQKTGFHLPKLKSKKKGGDKPYSPGPGRKIRTRNQSSAARAANSSRPRPPYVNKRPSNDRAYVPQGGNRLKIRSKTAQMSRRNVYPSNGPYVNNPSKYPKDNQRAYPNTGPYINNPSKHPKDKQRAYSNRRILSRVASLSSKRQPPGSKKVVSGRTASRSFVTRGRKNVYWGKFRKGEKAVTTDISGQPLRAKNFHTPGLGVIPSHDVYKRKNRKPGDKPYSGTINGYKTTPKVTKAWRGDVSGHAIRSKPPKVSQTAGRMFEPRKLSAGHKRDRAARPLRVVGLVKKSQSGKISNQPIQGKAPGIGASAIERMLSKFGGGKKPKLYGSSRIQSHNNKGAPIIVKAPGAGGRYVDNYAGGFKTKRAPKGGGSISGKARNNGGVPVGVKGPGIGGRFVDTYAGGIKTKRAPKGGGSISGRARNNGGVPVGVKGPGIGGRFVDTYAGGIKTKRAPKGGGSISGRARNNGGVPIGVKGPGIGGRFVDTYSGSIKASRPLKGGGSISGKSRNNGNSPIIVKAPVGIQAKYVDRYQGFLKGGRKTLNTDGSDYPGNKRIWPIAWPQAKAGGSISGKLWNNSNRPITTARQYKGSIQNKYLDIYQGFNRGNKPVKGGGSVSGKLWNNNEQPIEGKSFPVTARKVGNFPGDHKMKRSEKYIPNPNSKKEALKKVRPDKTTYQVGDLQVRVKAKDYDHNKLSAKAALKGESAGKNSLRAMEYSSRIKALWTRTFEPNKPMAGRIPMQKYVHAPNSKKGALMVHEPGKAYGRIKDLQINVKMTKPHGKNFHPDSKFANSYRDNVKHERTFLMNLKLKWAKLFKKNDTQPKAVKEKIRRPRYDPKERDLWKDLYD